MLPAVLEGFWYFDFQSALAGVLARLIILSPVITNASKFFLLLPPPSLESESLLPELVLPSLCSGRNGSLEADCVVLWLESPEEEIGSGRTEVDWDVLNAGEQEEDSEDIEGLLSNRGSSDDLLSLEGFPEGISGSRSFGREGVSSLERLQLNCGTLSGDV